MTEYERRLDGIASGKARGGILGSILIARTMTTRNGYWFCGQMHSCVEARQLDAIPEGAPDQPRGIRIVDDEIRIYRIPVVAESSAFAVNFPIVRTDDTPLVPP